MTQQWQYLFGVTEICALPIHSGRLGRSPGQSSKVRSGAARQSVGAWRWWILAGLMSGAEKRRLDPAAGLSPPKRNTHICCDDITRSYSSLFFGGGGGVSVVMCVVWERGSQRGQGNGSTYSKRGWMGGGTSMYRSIYFCGLGAGQPERPR